MSVDLNDPNVWEQIKIWWDEVERKTLAILDRQDDFTVGFVFGIVEGKRGYKNGLPLIDNEDKYKVGFKTGLQFGAIVGPAIKEMVWTWILDMAFKNKK